LSLLIDQASQGIELFGELCDELGQIRRFSRLAPALILGKDLPGRVRLHGSEFRQGSQVRFQVYWLVPKPVMPGVDADHFHQGGQVVLFHRCRRTRRFAPPLRAV
jgi:hypothetical protein